MNNTDKNAVMPADIQAAADQYIGHPYEVDEGVDVSMRREAYEAGMLAERERMLREPRKGLRGVVRRWIVARYGETRAPEKVIGYCMDIATLSELAGYVANYEDERLLARAIKTDIFETCDRLDTVKILVSIPGAKAGDVVYIFREAKK